MTSLSSRLIQAEGECARAQSRAQQLQKALAQVEEGTSRPAPDARPDRHASQGRPTLDGAQAGSQ